MQINNLKNKLNIIVLFILIYVSSSFLTLRWEGIYQIVIMLVSVIILMLINAKDIKIKKNFFAIVFFFILIYFITLLYNLDYSKASFIYLTSLIIAIIYSISTKKESFIENFNKVIYFISIFSIVVLLIYFMFPIAFNKVPIIYNDKGVPVYNLFLNFIRVDTKNTRNYGVFWEPGAFQFFLNLAIFFELFYGNKSRKRLIVYIIALLTTLSTTGIIGMFLIIIIYIYNYYFDVKSNIKTKKLIILSFLITLIVMPFVISTFLWDNVFWKLQPIFDLSFNFEGTAYLSSKARWDSIIIPIKAFLTNPVIGVGINNLFITAEQYNSEFVTATHLNWFAMFGLVGGALFTYPLYLWAKKSNVNNKLVIVGLFIFLILIGISEFFNYTSFYLIFTLIIFKSDDNKYKKVVEK